jgi:carbon storage regulator
MLVLSRQRDEVIMIGDDIEITVVDIRGDRVRLGMNVPRRTGVYRKEVYLAIQADRRRAEEVPARESQTVSTAKTSGTPAPEAPRRLYGGWRRKVRKSASW